MGCYSGRAETYIRASTRRTSGTAMVKCTGPMVAVTRVNGSEAFSMVMAK